MYLRGEVGGHPSSSTAYKTYGLLNIKDVISKVRVAEIRKGMPKRKLSPVFRYLLDELIDNYFKDECRKGEVLEKIEIEDTAGYEI